MAIHRERNVDGPLVQTPTRSSHPPSDRVLADNTGQVDAGTATSAR